MILSENLLHNYLRSISYIGNAVFDNQRNFTAKEN